MSDVPTSGAAHSPEVAAFWEVAKRRSRLSDLPMESGVTALEALQPPAWSFGGTPEVADRLLALVLDGTKTATASALWDYEAEGEEPPTVGQLSIVLDGAGHPRALVVTTAVEVRPFDQVDPEHAYLEGEDDRSLDSWRHVHREFFSTYASHSRGFAYDMPVVLERFRVLYRG